MFVRPLLWGLGVALLITMPPAEALPPVPAKYWKKAPIYDVTTLTGNLPTLLGKVVGVRFLRIG